VITPAALVVAMDSAELAVARVHNKIQEMLKEPDPAKQKKLLDAAEIYAGMAQRSIDRMIRDKEIVCGK
jgi:uncharacterized protein YmfQ (DUF2313 family)